MAVQWVDPATWTETLQLIWLRPGGSADDTFEPMTPEEILDHPDLAGLVNPTPEGSITVRTPSGDRTIDWPKDAADVEVSVSLEGDYLIYHAYALTADEVDAATNAVVAQSTEDGSRVVLVPAGGWTPRIAAGRLAYLSFPAYDNNSVCVKTVALDR